MNTLATHPPTSLSDVRQDRSALSPQARQLLRVGERNFWGFRLIGNAPMPDKPVRLGDWLIVPAHEDTNPIPPRAFARIQAIFAAGVRPQGFVLVHEAPMLLPASTTGQRTRQITTISTSPFELLPEKVESFVRAATPVLSTLVSFATAVLTLAATSVIPGTLLVGALLLDPILIAVTQDGDWIEIDRWWNEVET